MLTVSIDRIISKVIRDTRLVDSTYFADMYEWIPEAMRLLRTNVDLKPTFQEVEIQNHQGMLPCGLIDLEAVEYQGFRLGHYTGLKHPARLGKTNTQIVANTSGFVAMPALNPMPSGNVLDIVYQMPTTVHPSEGYQIHMGYISTSFANGKVILYFKEMPHDDRGLPLIPDHQDYKEAVYWYVRTKLIQSGYEDIMYGHDDAKAWQRFELHAARAISDITYPSVDQKEAQLAMSVRFIPPVDYFDSFFNSVTSEPLYGMNGPENSSSTGMLGDIPTSSLDLQNN